MGKPHNNAGAKETAPAKTGTRDEKYKTARYAMPAMLVSWIRALDRSTPLPSHLGTGFDAGESDLKHLAENNPVRPKRLTQTKPSHWWPNLSLKPPMREPIHENREPQKETAARVSRGNVTPNIGVILASDLFPSRP